MIDVQISLCLELQSYHFRFFIQLLHKYTRQRDCWGGAWLKKEKEVRTTLKRSTGVSFWKRGPNKLRIGAITVTALPFSFYVLNFLVELASSLIGVGGWGFLAMSGARTPRSLVMVISIQFPSMVTVCGWTVIIYDPLELLSKSLIYALMADWCETLLLVAWSGCQSKKMYSSCLLFRMLRTWTFMILPFLLLRCSSVGALFCFLQCPMRFSMQAI